jgi:hypothetical protein
MSMRIVRSATIAQPAAKTGPALRVIIAFGKLQGVMTGTTPIDYFITRMRLSFWWPDTISP